VDKLCEPANIEFEDRVVFEGNAGLCVALKDDTNSSEGWQS
jgi:hypothetical protein